MHPRQIQQQISSIALVSLFASIIVTFLREGFPASIAQLWPWAVVVAVTAVGLFLASGVFPFVWFGATRFQPRQANGGLLLWWLLLVLLAAVLHFSGIDL
jgi:hypothetical protein